MCLCNFSTEDKKSFVRMVEVACSHCKANVLPERAAEFGACVDAHLNGSRLMNHFQLMTAMVILSRWIR